MHNIWGAIRYTPKAEAGLIRIPEIDIRITRITFGLGYMPGCTFYNNRL